MVWCRSAVLSLSFFCAGRGRAAAVGTEWRRGCSWRRTVSVITTAEPSKEAFRHTSAPPSPSRALTAGPSTGSSSSLVPRTSVVTMASKPPTSRSSCSWPAFAINDAVKEPKPSPCKNSAHATRPALRGTRVRGLWLRDWVGGGGAAACLACCVSPGSATCRATRVVSSSGAARVVLPPPSARGPARGARQEQRGCAG